MRNPAHGSLAEAGALRRVFQDQILSLAELMNEEKKFNEMLG